MEDNSLFEWYLNPDTIKSNGAFLLSEILTETDYTTMIRDRQITVLNKAECGNGGTTGIIKYIKSRNTGCLILVPNVSIVMSKEIEYKDDPEVCCVYGGVSDINCSAKIVIATYDQFKRLLAKLDDAGSTESDDSDHDDIFSTSFWMGRAIFIDEYHKLVDEAHFREVMEEITKMIIRTTSPITLISATAHDEYILTLGEALKGVKDIRIKNIEYNRNVMSKGITMYDMKPKKMQKFIKYIIERDEKTCIFINDVCRMSEMLSDFKKAGVDISSCEILPSKSRKKECGEYYSDVYNPEKRVHFMTSAYFTGHDIKEKVDDILIFGSKRSEAMAISVRDIKQIIGRFRKYCGDTTSNITIFYVDEPKSKRAYSNIDKGLKHTNEILELAGDNWSKKDAGIKAKLENLYYKDAAERLEYWSTDSALIEKLKTVDTFDVYAECVNPTAKKKKYKGKTMEKEYPDFEVVDTISFAEAWDREARGEKVSWEDYPKAYKIRAYQEKYPESKKRKTRPTRQQCFDMFDITELVENNNTVSLVAMTSDERYDAFKFVDNEGYKASYLMNCIKYIKSLHPELLSEFGKLEYPLMAVYLKEMFGCNTIRENNKKECSSRDEWTIMGRRVKKQLDLAENDMFSDFGTSDSYISFWAEKDQNMSDSAKIKLSCNTENIEYIDEEGKKRTQKWAKTIEFNDVCLYMHPLEGNPIYDWVNENKAVRIYKMKMATNKENDYRKVLDKWRETVKLGGQLDHVKQTIFDKISGMDEHSLKVWRAAMESKAEKWDFVKNNEQLGISELYRESNGKYHHAKSEVDTINSLIVDIDKGLKFKKFCKMYKKYTWFAYPTISNTDPKNWHKFRVIVPLSQPVKLNGENNLRVLKALRQEFCVYEDPCHGLISYINPHDFEDAVINKGEIYSIDQEDVDILQHMLKVRHSYSGAFNNKNINYDTESKDTPEYRDKAIERVVREILDAKTGERNHIISRALYRIKDWVSTEQIEFIRQQINSDWDKTKEFNRLVKYLKL